MGCIRLPNISVVIPVGPYPANKRWLKECIQSVVDQTIYPELQILIVEDGAKIVPEDIDIECVIDHYIMPWRTGISHAFNYGVMYSQYDLAFMLGSDDTLEPTCLEQCYDSYLKRDKADGYYSVPIRYMDTEEVQTAPCNAAMVTKGFWRMSGGFPIETSLGIGDSTLLSICIKHKLPVYWVGEDTAAPETPLYNYRRHPDIHTYKINWGIAAPLRSHLTEAWSAEEVKQWSERY